MNVYKLTTRDFRWRLISQEDFASATHRDSPYYQKNKSGDDMHYAVCPECNNPIQIIGLYKKMKHTPKPYAKHCSRPVDGFPYFDPHSLKYCSLVRRTAIPLSKKSLRSFDDKARQILHLLVEYFDQVAYLFGKFTGIRMTPGLAKTMLAKYGSDGCLYEGASPMNVPWAFAYMADFQSLFNRIVDDPELRNSITQECPDIYFEGKQLKTRKYTTIGFWFTGHKQTCDAEGNLRETFVMVVTANEKNLVRKTIEFDHEHFRNLLYVSNDKRPRKEEYVAMAREALPVAGRV